MDRRRRISLSVLMSHNYYFISSLSPERAAAENGENDWRMKIEKSGDLILGVICADIPTVLLFFCVKQLIHVNTGFDNTGTVRGLIEGGVWAGGHAHPHEAAQGSRETAVHQGRQATEAAGGAGHGGQHASFSLSDFLSHISECEPNPAESRCRWPAARWLQAGKVWEGRWKKHGTAGRENSVVSFHHRDEWREQERHLLQAATLQEQAETSGPGTYKIQYLELQADSWDPAPLGFFLSRSS